MFEIERVYQRKKQKFRIYTAEEAEEVGIEPVYWRNAQPGQWGLTDDGYVGRCLDRKSYTDKQGRVQDQIKYPFAYPWARSKELSFQDNYETGYWSYSSPKKWDEVMLGKRRVKRAAHVYARMILTGKINWRVLGIILDPNSSTPVKTARARFKSKLLMEKVNESLEELMSDAGITQKDALQLFNEHKELTFGKDGKEGDGKPSDREAVIDRMFMLTKITEKQSVESEWRFDVSKIPGVGQKALPPQPTEYEDVTEHEEFEIDLEDLDAE